MKAVSTELELPLPTNRTENGPRLVFERTSLSVWWDYVEGARRRSATIVFREVLGYEFKQFVVSSADAVTGHRTLLEMSASPWLDELVKLWKSHVIMTDYEKGLGGPERFRHFHLYFDDVASIDVVASTYLIGGAEP